MRKFGRKLVLIFVLILIALQFIKKERSYLEVNPQTDFLLVLKAPKEVARIFKANCYDCHSRQVEYPWYASVAPISFVIEHHVEEGMEHLDFSDWTKYAPKKAAHKLEEIIEEVEKGKMPLKSYALLHGELSDEDKKIILHWVQTLR
jgi:mono/diheme cytochrome c family protein